MATKVDETLSDFNARIGRTYDTLPYNPIATAKITPAQIYPTAALYGYDPGLGTNGP